MTTLEDYLTDEQLRAAVNELEQTIEEHYAGTVFELYVGEDPEGVYLEATVDLDDPDEVTDLIIDRLVAFQVDHGLPLHVIPVRTPARWAALIALQREQAGWRTA